MKASTQDAIYNWLSIQVVVDERPTDVAAKETAEHFHEILVEDYQITHIEYTVIDEKYTVSYVKNGESKTKTYPADYVRVILDQIECNPEQFQLYE